MTPSQMKTTRFEALDGWRGLAALAICFYHVPVVLPMLQKLPRWENMELMVDLFLVLSGFVIAHSWGDRIRDGGSFRAFAAKRFWRIMPMHIAMLAVLVMLELAKLAASKVVALPLEAAPFTETKSIAKLVSNLFLTQAMHFHDSTSWNLPAWSISVEFWTYMVFGAVVLLARRMAMPVFLALILSALTVLVAVSPRTLLVSNDWGFARAIYDFFVGAVTYQLFRRGTLRSTFGVVGEIATVGLVLLFLCYARQDFSIWFAPFMFAMLVVVFAQSKGPVNRALESRPVQALGLWSYSIYMLHDVLNYIAVLVGQVGAKVLNIPLDKQTVGNNLRAFSTGNLAVDVSIALMLIGAGVWFSAYTWRYIEKPFLGGPRRARKSANVALA